MKLASLREIVADIIMRILQDNAYQINPFCRLRWPEFFFNIDFYAKRQLGLQCSAYQHIWKTNDYVNYSSN